MIFTTPMVGYDDEPRGIARPANVSVNGVLSPFTGTTALLAAVDDLDFALFCDAFKTPDAPADPRVALYGQNVAFMRFGRAHPALFRLMFGPQHGHAGGAAVECADNVLQRRASSLALIDSAAAKLACCTFVQDLAEFCDVDLTASSHWLLVAWQAR